MTENIKSGKVELQIKLQRFGNAEYVSSSRLKILSRSPSRATCWFTIKKLECLEFITCEIVACSVTLRPKKEGLNVGGKTRNIAVLPRFAAMF